MRQRRRRRRHHLCRRLHRHGSAWQVVGVRVPAHPTSCQCACVSYAELRCPIWRSHCCMSCACGSGCQAGCNVHSTIAREHLSSQGVAARHADVPHTVRIRRHLQRRRLSRHGYAWHSWMRRWQHTTRCARYGVTMLPVGAHVDLVSFDVAIVAACVGMDTHGKS